MKHGIGKLLFTALMLGASVHSAWGGEGRTSTDPQVVQFTDARLKIEVNATDGDAGIQVFVDGAPWKSLSIYDPHGRRVFSTTTKGRFAEQGGTELFLESAEPDFSELSLEQFLKRFPAGTYQFRGQGLEGERYVGSAKLTHNLPDGPHLVFPVEGAGPVDPNAAVLMWEPVGPANGSPIIAYQVIVARKGSAFPAIPKIVLDVMLPATATQVTIPAGFLQSGSEYEWEVLAIEAGGNQTLSTSRLQTQ